MSFRAQRPRENRLLLNRQVKRENRKGTKVTSRLLPFSTPANTGTLTH